MPARSGQSNLPPPPDDPDPPPAPGGGVLGAAVTLTVTFALVVPPSPVQVRLRWALPAVEVERVRVPDAPTDPAKPSTVPDALQLAASRADQVSVKLWPTCTEVVELVKLTSGAGGTGMIWSVTGADVAVTPLLVQVTCI